MVLLVVAVAAATAQGQRTSQWTQIIEHAPWGARAAPHGAVTKDGYFVVCSGRVGYTSFDRDCWSSADGGNWSELPTPGWSKRAYPEMVKLPNGSLLLMGGEGGVPRGPRQVSGGGKGIPAPHRRP